MIVVYYGVNLLSSCRSISRSAFLSLYVLYSFSPFLVLFRPFNIAPPSPSPSPSLWAILLCSRCSVRRKYSLFAPPLDMAKEAICALLAILEHFFEAFSSIDLFFALAPFRPASSASPCFPPSRSFIDSNLFHLPPVRSSQHHPGLVPISLGDIRPCCLHLPSFCRLVSQRSRTSLRLRLPVSVRPVHPCQPRAVRTRGVFTHRDDFGKPACVERGLVRTAMFHAPADVPRMGAPVMERAGSSGNTENGSHLAGADAAEGHARQVDGPGSSGNAENGSHLAVADAAEGLAGGGPSGVNENG